MKNPGNPAGIKDTLLSVEKGYKRRHKEPVTDSIQQTVGGMKESALLTTDLV